MHDFASAGVADPSAVSSTNLCSVSSSMMVLSGLALQSALTFGWYGKFEMRSGEQTKTKNDSTSKKTWIASGGAAGPSRGGSIAIGSW